MDNQSAFWSLYPYTYTERRFQQFRSHPQRQRHARERKNGNGMVETRHKVRSWFTKDDEWFSTLQLTVLAFFSRVYRYACQELYFTGWMLCSYGSMKYQINKDRAFHEDIESIVRLSRLVVLYSVLLFVRKNRSYRRQCKIQLCVMVIALFFTQIYNTS